MKVAINAIKCSFVCALVCGYPAAAAATQLYVTSQLAYFRVADTTQGTDKDYFALSGVSSLGNCGVYQGQVLFILKDDVKGTRQYAFVLSALRSGAPLTVYVEDSYKNGDGYCYVRTVE